MFAYKHVYHAVLYGGVKHTKLKRQMMRQFPTFGGCCNREDLAQIGPLFVGG